MGHYKLPYYSGNYFPPHYRSGVLKSMNMTSALQIKSSFKISNAEKEVVEMYSEN